MYSPSNGAVKRVAVPLPSAGREVVRVGTIEIEHLIDAKAAPAVNVNAAINYVFN